VDYSEALKITGNVKSLKDQLLAAEARIAELERQLAEANARISAAREYIDGVLF